MVKCKPLIFVVPDATYEQASLHNRALIIMAETLKRESAEEPEPTFPGEGGREVNDVWMEILRDDDVGAVLDVAMDHASFVDTIHDILEPLEEQKGKTAVRIVRTRAALHMLDHECLGIQSAEEWGHALDPVESLIDTFLTADQPRAHEGTQQPPADRVVLHNAATPAILNEQ
jgi:hypothetical protein